MAAKIRIKSYTTSVFVNFLPFIFALYEKVKEEKNKKRPLSATRYNYFLYFCTLLQAPVV